MPFTLRSAAFANGESIPSRCTGDGDDVSPPLEWHNAPEGTKSFALVMDDPDAPDPARPKRVWVHWVVAGIPAGTSSLPDAASPHGLPAGAVEGLNDSHDAGYSGPYPPIGRHRYVFTLYALDAPPGVAKGCTKADLLKAIEGHVLGTAQLTGTYARVGAR
jgi:Raf kinase inhibitor-like YbhB/YbcL family protein